ncbi:uncharacterized protein LOC122506353 [Leptopilina heterotoma]|uniref:uncharacterized protein LOC122506353 n=1 Tax=Leptopilina heterotoma TaxID=63436 RepID=UPI001CAA2B9D|nr:uncharacterized protein LOC122506353 [Leptopilina heterotoma]
MVLAVNKYEQTVECRAILDTCSSANFITENLALKLKLPMKCCYIPIGAVNNLTTVAKAFVSLTIRSLYNDYQKTFSFLIIPQIANLIPNEKVSSDLIPIPPNIQLADPLFHIPRPVDLLLGSGPSLSLFCIGQIDLSPQSGNQLLLQKTRLGWVVGGSVSNSSTCPGEIKCHLLDLQTCITKFWALEEERNIVHLSDEQKKCENHFREHVKRDASGKFTVALPFRDNFKQLGNSRNIALKRLYSLERKLNKSPELKDQYNANLQEYIDLVRFSMDRLN